ncbi:MAG: hypothetical protein KBF78_06135 [Fuscovulum sp.]|jgi:hypothetical protein|nr:hypothetical protein [Fuscovulum sp.]
MKPFPAILALALAACAAAPAPDLRPQPQPPGDPFADRTPGFNDREPDTCKAAALQGLIGQPSGNLRTMALPGPVRVIVPGDLVDQEEYRSDRIDVWVDGAGIIQRLSCG